MRRLHSVFLACTLALGGCSTLISPNSPLGATLNLAFNPPVGVALSAEEVDVFPYAAELIRIGENPQALIVLSQQAGGQDHYATSEGYLATFQLGRLVASSGFATDAEFLDSAALPNPAAAIGAARAVCWRSSWRATGAQRAGFFLLKGCLQPARAAQPGQTTVVTERVSSPLTGHQYINTYTLNDEQRVIASRQQLGPLLPVWQTQTVKHPSRAVHRAQQAQGHSAITASAWEPGPLQLTVAGLHTFTVRTQPTVHAVTQPLLADTRIDWRNSALYCTQDPAGQRVATVAVAELKTMQREWVSDVYRLVDYWQQLGARAHAASAQALAAEVSQWPLGRRVGVLSAPARTLFEPALNLALRCPAYTLVLAANSNRVPVMGLTHVKAFNLAAASPVQRFARVAARRPGASQGELWRISATGEATRFRLNPHTREPTTPLLDALLQAGDRLVVPWQAQALPAEFADLNARLFTLATHRVLESSHDD